MLVAHACVELLLTDGSIFVVRLLLLPAAERNGYATRFRSRNGSARDFEEFPDAKIRNSLHGNESRCRNLAVSGASSSE